MYNKDHIPLIVSFMIDFDKEYYDKLYEFFNTNNNKVYNIVPDLTTEANKEKFIAHVLFYQKFRHAEITDTSEVVLSFDQKQLMIVELFQNILNLQLIERFRCQANGEPLQEPEALPQPVSNRAATPIDVTATPTPTTYVNPFA